MKRKQSIIAAALCLGLAGCISEQDVQREIGAARGEAQQQWKHRREAPDGRGPRIDGRLSLEDALKLAVEHNRQLQAVVQERDIARGRVLSSYAGLLPTISLLSSYTRHDAAARSKGYIGSPNDYSAGIEITQPIFRGGAARAERRAARLSAYRSDEEIRQQTETTLYSVTANYYRALLAQQLLSVARDAVASAEACLGEVSRKRDNGAATEYSVLRARVEVALYQAQMIQQRNILSLATAQLLEEMGVEQDSRIELSGMLLYRPMEPVLDQAVEAACRHRPDLGRAQADVCLSEEAIRLAASRYWPQVRAFATGGWGRPDPYRSTRDEWDSHAAAGLRVELPLFDGLSREGEVIESKALLRKRQFELLHTHEQAVLEIRQAILSLRDAERFVESQQMNLQLAKEGLRLAEVGYRNGIHTEVDVTDARSALTRAMGLHYQAIHDHAVARLMFQKACGILSQSLEGPRE